MSTRSSRRATLASVMFAALLAGPTRAAAQCTHARIASPGIWVYLKETSAGGENLTIALVNLTDYLLLNRESTVTGQNNKGSYKPPFNGVPIKVKDINEDGVQEEGVPPYSSVSWLSYSAGANTISNPGDPQHYHGDLTLELVGYTTTTGAVLPTPSWPNKFHVMFTAQNADGWLDSSSDDMSGKGTWVALRPDNPSEWDQRNVFLSGVWTTPHYPADLDNPAPDDLDMRDIMTMSNRWVVVTMYRPNSSFGMSTRNIVIVVRQTNWFGPDHDVRTANTNPVADMDDYVGQKLDWKWNPSASTPRYNTQYYDSPYGRVWGCNYP